MRKSYLLLPALLLAGCRSEQVALQAPPAPVSITVAALATAATVVASLPVAAPLAATPLAAPRPTRTRLAPRRALLPVAAMPSSVTLASSPAPMRPRLLQRLALRRLATAGPAHTAESGLGRTVLFILAVVLALLAGLAALFALIPGVSFWGGLGLAVGALLVVGLLYKLLSGGKKK